MSAEPRPIPPALLGLSALRIGAREPGDLGLALAAMGAILLGLRGLPTPVRLPSRAAVALLLPRACEHPADEVLATADGIVAWLAAECDAALMLCPVAGEA